LSKKEGKAKGSGIVQKLDKEITDELNPDQEREQQIAIPLATNAEARYPKLSLPGRHLSAAQAAAPQQQQTQGSLQIANVFGQVQEKALGQVRKALTLPEVAALLKVTDPLTDRIEIPYTMLEFWRMHDTYRRDGTARRAVNLLADFTLGDRTMNVLDVTKEYPTKAQHDAAQKQLQANTEAQNVKAELDRINRVVNFDHWCTAAFVQCKVFGRAVLVIQDDPQTGLPDSLKLLSSMRLGRIFVNQVTWEIEGVEYIDYQGIQSIIPKDKMIYFTNLDYGISPNTLGMGLATLRLSWTYPKQIARLGRWTSKN